jgi:hypothetical protein
MYTDALQQERKRLDQLKVILGIICLYIKFGILVLVLTFCMNFLVIGSLSIPVKSPSLAVTKSFSAPEKSHIPEKSVEKRSDVKIKAAVIDENMRPREEIFTSSNHLVSDYKDFIKWKMQLKHVVPKK